MTNLLLLIDGNALLYRAYHSMPDFSKPGEQPTNAVYGFANMLHKAIQDFSPTHLAVCFDAKGPTFRNELFAGYQENRPKADDELVSQMLLVREMLDAADIPRYEMSGFEADDLLGTIAFKFGDQIHIDILTGDKDILQLVTNSVSVIMLKTGLSKIVVFTPDLVKETLGVWPTQIPDLKSLMGDASDNYKGIHGIGPKSAQELFKSNTTLEDIYTNIDQVKSPKIREALIENKEFVELCKKLATIKTDAQINFDLEGCRFSGYSHDLKQFFVEHKFKTLMRRIFDEELSDQTGQAHGELQQTLF